MTTNPANDPNALLPCVELRTEAEPEWTVIWLHGLGADGNDFVPIAQQLVRDGWPPLRFVFPHAPVRPVTFNGGVPMRAWYDIAALDFAHRADADGVAVSVAQVERLIAREAERGVPPGRVILAGFSQGGAITLAAGLRRSEPLAGLIALSTYLPQRNDAAEFITEAARQQPVFMGHGRLDPVVPHEAGEATAGVLRALGVEVEWHDYPMPHSVSPEEVRDLAAWLTSRFEDAAG